MNKTIKFIIDTVIVACIPELQKLISNVISSDILSCAIAAAIAVASILAIEKFATYIIAKRSGLDGKWYEYIIPTPERPFSVCNIKRHFLSNSVEFSGTNYSKDLNNNNTVDFSSTHLWFIENGFVYMSKGDGLNTSRDKYALGKYVLSNDKNNGLIVARGFFIDTTEKDPMIKDVIMYKANKYFYSELGLVNRKEKSITSKEILERLPDLIQKDTKPNIADETTGAIK